MNPESADLLDDLTTAGRDSGDFLVRALRVRQHHRAQRRTLALFALTGLAILIARFVPGKGSPSPLAVTPSPKSFQLTENELLDSFPHQPVALVTWPDGRQQLLAIAHPSQVRK